MEIEEILNIINAYLPAVVSIITMICTAILTIKKVATSKADEITILKAENRNLRNSNKELSQRIEENTQAMEKLAKKLSKIKE